MCQELKNSWIFVLNTNGISLPRILDGEGQSKEIGFWSGSGTEAYHSCSIVWRGAMYLFGGSKYKRQISVVDKCKLTKKGELPFDLDRGACAQRENQKVFICFENMSDSATYKNCHVSNDPLEAFSKLRTSKYDHRQSRIAVTSSKP